MVLTVLTTQINKIKNSSLPELLLYIMAPVCFLYALYIATKYAQQLPLDFYAFRQTQTALTAYWMIKDGFRLAYETPVGGPPWSIPFEFPIYQYIVALVAKFSGWPLAPIGRLLSFSFLALCALPVRSIMRDLKISRSAFLIFIALLFSSPLYLYWGRTFMIETAALFFTIAGLKYFVDIVQSRNSLTNGLLFVLFITLGILQKATTGLPVLLLTCFIYLYLNLKSSASLRDFIFGKTFVSALVYFGVPLSIGVAWTEYTDYVKGFNLLGAQLTSSALGNWNWGTWDQRFSAPLYLDVIWQRIFRDNLCGGLGLGILIAAFLSKAQKEIKLIILLSLLLGLLPIYLFTNLHLIHKYYQSANLIFFLFALATAIGHILDGKFAKKTAAFTLALIFVCFHFVDFHINYYVIENEYDNANSLPYALSQVLHNEVPEYDSFAAFGNDWSSTLAYLSERKSFTVPTWLKRYDEVAANPENFVPTGELGAVVLCPFVKSPTINNLIRWSSTDRRWKVGQVHECYIATPEIPPPLPAADVSASDCRASLEFAGERQVGNERVFSIEGWVATAAGKSNPPARIYVSLSKADEEPRYLEAQQMNRAGANPGSANAKGSYRGFSRILSADMPAGEYSVKIARMRDGHLESCQ